jgi:thiol-disulfide isomerase/thioredoxin
MKKKSPSVLYVLILAGTITLHNGCRVEKNQNDYLQKVLTNLEQIVSASYYSITSGTAPGDTTKMSTYTWYKKEYINTADTTIGSGFAWFYADDTSKMYLFYDGTATAYLNFDKKIISIDSFKTNTLPFRPVSAPFFNRAKSIIKYALDTKDSLSTEIKEFDDSIRFTVYIPHKNIHFFGKPITMESQYLSKEESFSRYEIWINRTNDLPYRIIHKNSYSTDAETCKNPELNRSKPKDFRAEDYFPPDFEIKVMGEQQPVKKELVGKAASDWILTDYNNLQVSFKDLKSKVLLVEFTGIGCAPCHSAIPFLKQLVSDNKDKDFELVSIETWGSDIEGLKRYHKNNGLNYRFLESTEEIKKKYQVQGVPVFYLIDKNRVIRKIIRGYSKGTTDNEIRDAINDLLR